MEIRPLSKKQEQLGRRLFDAVKARFPELQIRTMYRSPEDPETVWVWALFRGDEDRREALAEYAAEVATDLLLETSRGVILMTDPVPA